MTAKARWRKQLSARASIYVLSNFLLLLLGTLFTVLSAAADQPGAGGTQSKFSVILLGLGLSVFATGVTGFIMLIYLYFAESLNNRVRVVENFGIENYFESNTTAIKGEYADRLNKSNKEIAVLGLGVEKLKKDFADKFAGWSKNGKVRILLLDPNHPTCAPYAEARDVEESTVKGSILKAVEDWGKLVVALGTELDLRNFEIRLYKSMPTLTMVRADKELFWSPYLAQTHSSDAPTMLVKQGGILFDVMLENFDKIWNADSTTIMAGGRGGTLADLNAEPETTESEDDQ